MVNPDNYIVIQGWMISDLKLKGNDLLVYAIIYGFTQDGVHKFTGGLQYLADWCNSTKQGIQKNLSNLVEQGLLLKEDYKINNVPYCKYWVITGGMQQSCMGIQQSCTYNKNIKNKDIVSKDTISDTTPDLVSPEKPKRKNLFQKCIDMIHEYTNETKLQDALVQYLELMLEKARNECKPLYANQFKGMLNKLDELVANGDGTHLDIVNQSIMKSYVGFFPANKNVKSNYQPDTNKAPQHLAGEKAKNEDGTLMRY